MIWRNSDQGTEGEVGLIRRSAKPAAPSGRRGSLARWAGLAALFTGIGVSAALAAAAYRLAPYADDLFANEVIQTSYGGDYVIARYSKDRDLYGRDEVVEKKAFAKFVSLEPDKVQKDLVLPGKNPVRYVAVGRTDGGAKIIVIFLHGDKGNRNQGVDDWSFGGNFNRLKNLMARNDGLYVSASFANFGDAGTADVEALIEAFAANAPGAAIVVACTSRSGVICFRLFEDDATAKRLGGMVLLAAGNEESFFKTPVFTDPSRHIPIFIAHGSKDRIITWVTQELFFKKVKEKSPDYPIKLTVFKDGQHGTPMRLTDWRQALNWILAVDGK